MDSETSPHILQLLYLSRAKKPFSSDALQALLSDARLRNADPKSDITGVLLYFDEIFLQVIEGSPKNVHSLFASIKRDTRHHSIIVLEERPLVKRQFKSWRMGWKGSSKHYFLTLTSSIGFFTDEFWDEQDTSRASAAHSALSQLFDIPASDGCLLQSLDSMS